MVRRARRPAPQAPPVTREWPAGSRSHPTPRAAPWPPVLIVAFSLALVLLFNHGALDAVDPTTGNVCVSLAALAVAYAAFSLLATGLSRGWRWWRCSSRMTVDEDPRVVAERLRAMDVQGRARLCRDVAVRCLEGAARFERLEARLRREAAGWMRMMIKEMER